MLRRSTLSAMATLPTSGTQRLRSEELAPWRQAMFPDPGSPIISQHESAIVLDATKDTSIPGSKLDDEVTFSISTTSEELLLERPDGIAMEVMQYFLFSVNSADLVETPEGLKDLVRQGYKFNHWREPADLLI
jgi:hypothetical protein